MERQISRFGRQLAAMHLILSMEDSDGSLPNITYIANRPDNDPPSIDDLDPKDLMYLRDMFYLMDFNLYKTYHKLIHSGISGQTADSLRAALSGLSAISEATSIETGNPVAKFWSGSYPHGCYWVLREVVAQLLV